jgi:hypothetical protein
MLVADTHEALQPEVRQLVEGPTVRFAALDAGVIGRTAAACGEEQPHLCRELERQPLQCRPAVVPVVDLVGEFGGFGYPGIWGFWVVLGVGLRVWELEFGFGGLGGSAHHHSHCGPGRARRPRIPEFGFGVWGLESGVETAECGI